MKKILLLSVFALVATFAASAKEDRVEVEATAAICPLHNETTQIFSRNDLPKDGGEQVIFNNVSIDSAAISLTVWTKKNGWTTGVIARIASCQTMKTKPPKDIENYKFFALTSLDKKPYTYAFSNEDDDLVVNIMDK